MIRGTLSKLHDYPGLPNVRQTSALGCPGSSRHLARSRFVVSGEGDVDETGNKRVDVAQAVAHQALKAIGSSPIPTIRQGPVLGEGARGVGKKKGSRIRKPESKARRWTGPFYSYIATP
jgi:hypothetical protein